MRRDIYDEIMTGFIKRADLFRPGEAVLERFCEEIAVEVADQGERLSIKATKVWWPGMSPSLSVTRIWAGFALTQKPLKRPRFSKSRNKRGIRQ